jgi:hypothetical protein
LTPAQRFYEAAQRYGIVVLDDWSDELLDLPDAQLADSDTPPPFAFCPRGMRRCSYTRAGR